MALPVPAEPTGQNLMFGTGVLAAPDDVTGVYPHLILRAFEGEEIRSRQAQNHHLVTPNEQIINMADPGHPRAAGLTIQRPQPRFKRGILAGSQHYFNVENPLL